MGISIIKIVLCSLALLLCLTLLVVVMAKEGLSFSVLNLTYENAELYTAGNIEYSKDTVSSLKLKYRQGAVKLVRYDGDTVKVEELDADSEENTVHTRVTNGTLFIQFGASRVAWFERLPNKTLTVYIPNSLNSVELEAASAGITLYGIDAKELEVNTASGAVTATDSSFDEIDINTASGDVDLTASCRSLDVNTASGEVAFTGDASNVSVETASGEITLNGSFGEVELETASGDATVEGTLNSFEMDTASGDATVSGAPKRLSFDSASGDITVRLPKGTEGVSAIHDGASGDMTVVKDGREMEGGRYSEAGAINHTFEFDTASGDVIIIFEN